MLLRQCKSRNSPLINNEINAPITIKIRMNKSSGSKNNVSTLIKTRSQKSSLISGLVSLSRAKTECLREYSSGNQLYPLPFVTDGYFEAAYIKKIHYCSMNKDNESINFCAKACILREICAFFEFPSNNKLIDTRLVLRTIEMILSNIIRPIPELNPLYSVYDEVPISHEKTWIHQSICYQILEKILVNHPDQICKIPGFLLSISSMLSVPFKDEREILINVLATMVNSSSLSTYDLLLITERIIRNHIEETKNPYGVISSLEILMILGQKQHFNDIKNQPLPIVRKLILKLLVENDIGLYKDPLQRMIQLLSYDSSFLELLINRLIMKYPIVDTHKQAFFLDLLLNSLKLYCNPLNYIISHKIISILKESIMSDNCLVSMSILNHFNNTFTFSKRNIFYSELPHELSEAIIYSASHNWYGPSREAARLLMESFNLSERQPKFRPNSNTTSRKWTKIIKLAADNSDIENFEQIKVSFAQVFCSLLEE